MSQDNHPDPTLVGDAGTTSANGGAKVESSTLSLSELNEFLGTNYADKDSALTAMKETKSFVGKRQQDIEAEVRAKLASESSTAAAPLADKVSSLERQLFYSAHPEYKAYESIIAKMGSDPAAVVATEEFKTVFEKVKVADEVAKTRSVVASSARVGTESNATEEAVRIANATRSTERTADALASAIVKELGLQ